MINIKYFLCGAIIFSVAILIVNFFYKENEGTVIIVNQSIEEISSGSLEVCGQAFNISRLRVGESQEIHYKVNIDSGYKVSIIFPSGKNINGEVGYVTHGFDFNDTLIVKPENIIIDNLKHKE